ncbi:hypothetical protein [Kineosporia sp. NBRC 101731]|uniref:hypothetical protein n=1 Tax=Kineosporia sp. NBRC 101731 TaxID=3032199 RepID=UPI0024A365E0|nr:hypothetical protein [Kineosporia sp. NBRC 101731]GLY29665.1 hypothetical protein Kisp02_30300 [Kineosporia sp. NBRC 101731]
MYTLSSPTVLATDAAAHPHALPLLRGLSGAFRISEDGAYALAQAWHDRDESAHGVAWVLVALLDMNVPTMAETLKSAGATMSAESLATGRFGTSSQVAALVATAAADWPDAAIAPVPGTGFVPASAAVAAAAAAGLWARPQLEAEQVAALRAPFEQAASRAPLYESGDSLYGPRSTAVLELIDRVRTGQVTPAQLAGITWPAGVWAQAMHEAAWACHRENRLREQMRAVLDVTLEFVQAHPDLSPAGIRECTAALHAMTVSRLVADVADEKAVGDLTLAEFGI